MVVDGFPFLFLTDSTPIDPLPPSVQAFLSYIKIIDYSLLVGCDENRQELVVSALLLLLLYGVVGLLSCCLPPPLPLSCCGVTSINTNTNLHHHRWR